MLAGSDGTYDNDSLIPYALLVECHDVVALNKCSEGKVNPVLTPLLIGTVAISLAGICAPGISEADPPATGKKSPLKGSWQLVTEHAEFSPRDTAEDVVFDGKMWISNAYHAGNVLVRDLWNSKDGRTWTKVLDETPYDGYSEMVVYNGKMWAIKGSVWSSSDGLHWDKVLDKTPFGVRGYGEVVVHDGKIWQLGSGPDVWWTTDGVNWTCAAKDAPFGSRYGSAVTSFGGKLWLMGGAVQKQNDPPEKHYAAFTTCNDVWCSSDGANWTRVLEHAPWEERMWFVSKVYAKRVWIIGGFSNRKSINFAEAWYTDDGVTWYEFVSEKKWSPRHEPTCYVFDNSLWVVAGNSWPLMNDVWKLTLLKGYR